MKALAVLSTAMAQAQRELKEAANLPSVAGALLQSAQEELRCAQAIRSELLLLGQEALNELDAAPFARQPGAQEITISDPQDLADAGLLGAVSPESTETQRVPPARPLVEPGPAAPSLSDALSGQASVAWESRKPAAEPPVAPEPEISDWDMPVPKFPEEAPEDLAGGFESPEPAIAPPAAELGTVPRPSPEGPEAAPPSAWFTEDERPPPTEAPATTPPPETPPVLAPSEAQVLEEEIAAATPASEPPGSAAAALAEELARGMGDF